MSEVEQDYRSQGLHEEYREDDANGMTKRELVFLKFMSKLISSPDQFDCTLSNRANKAKRYTKKYFETLEEWDDED